MIPEEAPAPTRLRTTAWVGRLRCLWYGHYWWYDLDSDQCQSCGKTLDYHTLVTERGLLNWYAYKRQKLSDWWKPCPDCGKRFGRHDWSKDHVPF